MDIPLTLSTTSYSLLLSSVTDAQLYCYLLISQLFSVSLFGKFLQLFCHYITFHRMMFMLKYLR